MATWWKRSVPWHGLALFPGSLPPPLASLDGLVPAGVRVTPQGPGEKDHWRAAVEHDRWGRAEIACPRDFVPIPEVVVKHTWGLTDAERQAVRRCRSGVTIHGSAQHGSVLRDRKSALRFLHAALGEHGVAAMDPAAQKIWSLSALDDELRHDADLDVEALYTMHAIQQEGSQRVRWLHSHGLQECGAFDFDILDPGDPILGPMGSDLLRAIAFAVLEERVAPSGSLEIAHPRGPVWFVDVARFTREADPALARGVRDADDPDHQRNRVVLCEPAGGLLSRWFGRTVRPSRFLSNPGEGQMLVSFSTPASDLMAERARKTWPVLQEVAEELAPYDVGILAKVGYRVDGGGEDEREHLWFQVHSLGDERFEATLLNSPFGIARMKQGDRGEHPVECLSDWSVFTPVGPINPRSLVYLRLLRALPPEVKERLPRRK